MRKSEIKRTDADDKNVLKLFKTIQALANDRDYWKKRAERLKLTIQGALYKSCETCKHNLMGSGDCRTCDSGSRSNWKFDDLLLGEGGDEA